jgi:hypothetical protein
MNWPFRRREAQPAPRLPYPAPRLPHARPITDAAIAAAIAQAGFACATCGRTDLEPAGDWDPPVCAECDAAINADALALERQEDAGDR